MSNVSDNNSYNRSLPIIENSNSVILCDEHISNNYNENKLYLTSVQTSENSKDFLKNQRIDSIDKQNILN